MSSDRTWTIRNPKRWKLRPVCKSSAEQTWPGRKDCGGEGGDADGSAHLRPNPKKTLMLIPLRSAKGSTTA